MIDTGVLVSAFAFGGIPDRAVKEAFAKAELFVSPDLLKEYRDVPLAIKEEGKLTHDQFEALISGLAARLSHEQSLSIPREDCLSAETKKTICWPNVALKPGQGSALAGTKTFLNCEICRLI